MAVYAAITTLLITEPVCIPLELHSGHFNITAVAGIEYKFSLSAIDFYWNKSKGIGVANTRSNVYHKMGYSIHY